MHIIINMNVIFVCYYKEIIVFFSVVKKKCYKKNKK